jgi:CBS domain-containing protein
MPSRNVLAIPDIQTIGNTLQLLAANDLKCAVVANTFETPPRALNFVDTYDISMCVLDAIGWKSDLADERVGDMINAAMKFINKEVSLVQLISERDPINARTSDTPLFEIATLMSNGIHRVLITDNGMVTNIISQSDIIRAVVNRMDVVGRRARLRIEETQLVTKPVATIASTQTVVKALHLMRLKGVTGLPVVDELTGKVVASFSSSDILGLSEDTFYTLALKIPDFLLKFYGFIKPPIVCLGSDTVENLFFKFVVYGIHRIFIVDENMIPTGVISLTDVMKFLIA